MGQNYLGLLGDSFVDFEVGPHEKITLTLVDRLLAPSCPFTDPFI